MNIIIKKINIKLSIPLLLLAFAWGWYSSLMIFGAYLGIAFGCMNNCPESDYYWIGELSTGGKIKLFTLGLPGLIALYVPDVIPNFPSNPILSFVSISFTWVYLLIIGPFIAYLILSISWKIILRFYRR